MKQLSHSEKTQKERSPNNGCDGFAPIFAYLGQEVYLKKPDSLIIFR